MSARDPQRPIRKTSLLPYALMGAASALIGAYVLLRRRGGSARNANQLREMADMSSSGDDSSIDSRTSVSSYARPDVGQVETAPPDPRLAIRPVHVAALIAILLVGFYFRFAGLNWDDGQHLHPDERFLTQVLTAVEIPDSLGEYFDAKTSPINPRNKGYTFFVYGDFPITFTRLVAEGLASLCAPAPNMPIDPALGRPAPTVFDSIMRGLGLTTFCYRADGSLRPMTGYDEVALTGRVISALLDLGTLLWLFLIAREIYGTRAGLVATALGALAVLNIQQAHFFTADTFATFFVTAAMYFVVRAGRTGSTAHFAASGALTGLAMACRINVAPVLGIAGLAAFGRVMTAWNQPGESRVGRLERALLQVVVALFAAAVAFRIFMPNAFDGLLSFDERWSENMSSISQIVSGEASSPPDVQWTDRKPFIFPWVNMVFWGLGPPLGLAAWIGWAVAAWQMIAAPYVSRQSRTIGEWLRGVFASPHLLIWAWVAGYFAWQASQWVKSMRYLLPLYPFMAMFAGWALVAGWDWAQSASRDASHKLASYKRFLRGLAYAAPVIVIAGTFLWAVAFTAIYRQPTTRVAASEWIYENIPSAATLTYTDARGPRSLQIQLPRVTSFFGPGAIQVTGFKAPSDGELTGITFRDLSDPNAGVSGESVRLIVSIDPDATQVVAEGGAMLADGDRLEFEFVPSPLRAGTTYFVVGRAGPDEHPINFSARVVADLGGNPAALDAAPVPGLPPGVLAFSVPQDGTLLSATADVTGDPAATGSTNVLKVTLAMDPDGSQVIAQGQLEVPGGALPGAYRLPLGGARLVADQQYYFIGEATRGSLVATSTTLANEHWDDGVPLRTGGRDGFSFYRGIEIANYNDDTPEKLGQMIGWLQEADYIMLTSNRLYGSIPRQPLRYPLATEYYRLLFTGQLGFDLVAEFASYPTLGPLEFPDQETTQALGVWPDPTRIARPGLISVPYPPAEEAFSVYDHPRVIIFKKRSGFKIEDVIAQLSHLDLETAYNGFKPRDETASPTGQMLDAADVETQAASGTWSDLFDRDSLLNTSPGIGALAWYLVVGVLGLAAFPILYVAVPGLADRGYGLARTLGVLLLSFLVWFPASFRVLPFTRESILLAAIVLAAIGGLIASRKRAEIGDWVRRNARLLLIEELVFAAAFLLFLLLRFGNPDLWHPWKGGEKPMDFAYFNAVIKSQYFPAYDPWFSGGFMTYYYYGWVMLAALVKLLGIVPAIAYNIGVPTIYALAAMGTFSVAHGLASRFGPRFSDLGLKDRLKSKIQNPKSAIRVGVVAAVFVMLMGNLGEVKLLYDKVGELGRTDPNQATQYSPLYAVNTATDFVNGFINLATGQKQLAFPTDWWYWNPTRIIPAAEGEAGPITEMPFFTFLYADLHAHMMALPITILVIGLATSWVVRAPLAQKGDRFAGWLNANRGGLLSLALGGLAVGALRATNTADYPTYLGFAVVAIAFGTWAAGSLTSKETWLWFVVRVVVMYGAAAVLWSPFNSSDRLGGAGLEGWLGSKTELWSYLFVHGIFLFPIVTYLVVEWRRWGARWTSAAWSRLGDWWWLVAIPVGIALLAMAYFAVHYEAWIIIVAVPIIAAAGILMLRPRLPAVARLWMLMVALALALTVAVELVVFRGDISRMNMVFKFYYQVWVLLGIAAAVALGWLWQRAGIAFPKFSGAWRVAMIALVVGGMLYPPFAAINGKLKERFNAGDPPTLDGLAYMQNALYTEVNELGEARELNLGWDYDAITWMQDNIAGTPVVAEGRSKHEYLWGSRVAINTGLPTILGWSWHQKQQRGAVVPHTIIDQRIRDVAELFGGLSPATTRKILDRYGVKYVYVGELEQMYYPAEALAKFDRMAQAGELRVAHENPGVRIYEVISNQ